MRRSRQANETKTFEARCQQLFSVRLGFGRKWKTACAQALGIGRATLYRYFGAETAIPEDVTRRLVDLEKPQKPVRSDREMVIVYASGLVEMQKRIDERGCLSAPYPRSLQRAFDLGAANNILSGASNWPTDLISLSRCAQEPLFRWVQDMSWDSHDEFFSARLIENGEVGTDCLKLAINDGDPEREIEENFGYDLLVGICRNQEDGDDLYRTWRRIVVENPVLQNWSSTILVKNPVLAGVNRIDEIVEAFYDNIPESLNIDGNLPLCSISGTILRRDGSAFHTESRDPEAVRRARAGLHTKVKYRTGMRYLKRAFRMFWSLPGIAELDLEHRLRCLGWDCTLWPNIDRVDLTAISPDQRRPIAVDVKTYFSPARLAARFKGFKEYETSHDCVLVVPDYTFELDQQFRERFEAFRAAQGKPAVKLRTVSALVSELQGLT